MTGPVAAERISVKMKAPVSRPARKPPGRAASRFLPGPTRWPMPLALQIGKCSLLGNYRENNEDAIELKQFPDMTISLVADGMGGQAYGEVASKRAIEVV